MNGSSFQTKPGFEVKGSSREEDSRCKCGVKGTNWGMLEIFSHNERVEEYHANVLNDVLLETQQDQKNMQICCGGAAGYLKTGQCETAVSDLTRAGRRSHRF